MSGSTSTVWSLPLTLRVNFWAMSAVSSWMARRLGMAPDRPFVVRLAPMREAVARGAASVAVAQTPKAQTLKNWRHGIIEAKSDAGILFAASRRDFAATLG